LLQYPTPPSPLYATTDIDGWINQARQQLAGESESIRILGTIQTIAGQRNYNFSNINTGVSATNGVNGALNVRSILYAVGNGQAWTRPRNWEWFQLYKLNNAVPPSGPPQVWSQYAQGSQGSFYLDPIPDDVYTLTCDCVCLPINLVTDSTVEAIPPLWTDAVAYFAAYLALLSAQSAQRQADAQRMLDRYTFFVDRGRKFATPEVNKYLYPQNQDPTMLSKLGIQPKSGVGG
jgi:hypothetical protein